MFEKAMGDRRYLLNPLAACCPFECEVKCSGSGAVKISLSSIENYRKHLAKDHPDNPAAGVLSQRLAYLFGGDHVGPHPMASLAALDQAAGELELTGVRLASGLTQQAFPSPATQPLRVPCICRRSWRGRAGQTRAISPFVRWRRSPQTLHPLQVHQPPLALRVKLARSSLSRVLMRIDCCLRQLLPSAPA